MRRGQVIALFILFGVMFLFLIGFFVALKSMSRGENIERMAQVATGTSSFKEHVEQCLRREALEALDVYGPIPGREHELAAWVERGLPSCVDAPFYREQGVALSAGKPAATVSLSERTVAFSVDYPLTGRDASGEFSLEMLGFDVQRVTSAALRLDGAGKLAALTETRSSDGDAELRLAAGTAVDGVPGGEIALKMLERTFRGNDNPLVVGAVVYEGLPSGASFSPAAELTLQYRDEDVPSWYDERNLRIGWLDESRGYWRSLPTQVDTAKNTLTARISHFSTYAPLMFCSAAQVDRIEFPHFEQFENYPVFEQDCGTSQECAAVRWKTEDENLFEDPETPQPYHKNTASLVLPLVRFFEDKLALRTVRQVKADGGYVAAEKPYGQVPLATCRISDWDSDDASNRDSQVKVTGCVNSSGDDVDCPTLNKVAMLRDCQRQIKNAADADYSERMEAFVRESDVAQPVYQDGLRDETPYLSQPVNGCLCTPEVDRGSVTANNCRASPATANTYGYLADGTGGYALPGGFGVVRFRLKDRGGACVAEDSNGRPEMRIRVSSPSRDRVTLKVNPARNASGEFLKLSPSDADTGKVLDAWNSWDSFSGSGLYTGEFDNTLMVRVENSRADGCAAARLDEFAIYGTGFIFDYSGYDFRCNTLGIAQQLMEEQQDSGLPDGPARGECTYCGDNKDIFLCLYPVLFNASGCSSPGYWPKCCNGPCPPKTIVAEIPIYDQCLLARGSQYGDMVCQAGCGPTSLKMAFESVGLGAQDIDALIEELGTTAAGTSKDDMERVATEKGVFYGREYDLPLSALAEHLEQGRVPVLYTNVDRYNEELGCTEDCYSVNHYLVVVGVTPNGIIVNDPYHPQGTREGEHVIISAETLDNLYAGQNYGEYFIIQPEN